MRAKLFARLAWLRLNADGAMIAFLAMSTGLQLIDPASSDLAQRIGFVPPSLYFWTIGYVVAGVMMGYAFVFRKIGPELLGRLLMCLCFSIESIRVGILIDWDAQYMLSHSLTWAVLILVCIVRATTLLSKHGLAIVIPGREHLPPTFDEETP